MPPRLRRESQERREQRISKHVAQAREYWAKGAQHLRENDLCQATEKGWGTVAQLTKAMATLRSWDHYDHIAIRECVLELAGENPDLEREIYRRLLVAEELHGQFYEIYMTRMTVEIALEEIEPLLEILWGFLPEEYTGGGAFSEQTTG